MQILNPGYLFLALLGVIPLLLYFFRRKSKTVPVSTLVFFKSLAREHQESAWLRHLKKIISLLLTLAILLGVIFALSRFVFSPRTEGLESVVVLLDRSASMKAVDEEGKDRLETAKAELKARLAGVPEDVGVSLIVYDSRPELLLPTTYKRRQMLALLEQVKTRPVPDDEDKALAQARMIASLNTPAEIWHFTDRVAETRAVRPEGDGEREATVEAVIEEGAGEDVVEPGIRVRRYPVALQNPVNVGITAFQVRKVPLVHSRYEAYIQVAGAQGMAETAVAELEVQLGGIPVQIRELEVAPGGREGVILPLDGAAGQILEIKVHLEGDCFAEDNQVAVQLPEERPLIVAWITEEADPFTELALSSISEEGELELWKGSPSSWPLEEEVDVVIFDGWLPDEWPDDLPVMVLNPPGSLGPVKAVPLDNDGIPHADVRASNSEHPVLFRVSSSRVALTQTAVIDTSGSLEPLWFAGNEPILAAGEVQGQRLVIMAFSAERSERLPLMASYPLLLGNAVLWCADAVRAEGGFRRYRTGEVIDVEGPVMTWRELTPQGFKEETVSLDGPLVELDRIGLWQGLKGEEGSSLLLSRGETNLEGLLVEDGDAAAAMRGEVSRAWLRGEITWLLLWGVLVFLLLESWLFHRHAVY